jgi:hypothetical protein
MEGLSSLIWLAIMNGIGQQILSNLRNIPMLRIFMY